MATTKKVTRPLFEVIHEYSDSFEEYREATNLLLTAAETALKLGKTPEQAAKALAMLAPHVERLKKAAYGEL